MTGRAGVDEQAEKVRVYREFVARRGRRDLGNGDYSVDPGWHTAAELLPVIDSLAAELASLKDALERLVEANERFKAAVEAEDRDFVIGFYASESWIDALAAAREALGRQEA